VLAKTPLHLGFEHADLLVHGGDHRDDRAHARAVGIGERVGGQAELVAAPRPYDPHGGGVDVALPSSPAQRRGDLRP
jgi:hypothetical protein